MYLSGYLLGGDVMKALSRLLGQGLVATDLPFPERRGDEIVIIELRGECYSDALSSGSSSRSVLNFASAVLLRSSTNRGINMVAARNNTSTGKFGCRGSLPVINCLL